MTGVRVEVLNVLGAGDAFMSGLLRGYLNDEGWEQACRYANACGALVVSRHGCARRCRAKLSWMTISRAALVSTPGSRPASEPSVPGHHVAANGRNCA